MMVKITETLCSIKLFFCHLFYAETTMLKHLKKAKQLKGDMSVKMMMTTATQKVTNSPTK